VAEAVVGGLRRDPTQLYLLDPSAGTGDAGVQFFRAPIETGENVGVVATYQGNPDVVLGPVGLSSSSQNLTPAQGGFLYPTQVATAGALEGIVGPVLPLSLDPATNLPPAGPFKVAATDPDQGTVALPGGTIIFLVNSNPQRYRTIPFPPAEVGDCVFVGTDPPNALFPKRVRFLPDTPTAALRGEVGDIETMSLDINGFDFLVCSAFFSAFPTVLDRFVIEDAPIARVTPVLEVILG